jgi:hypothetical protein
MQAPNIRPRLAEKNTLAYLYEESLLTKKKKFSKIFDLIGKTMTMNLGMKKWISVKVVLIRLGHRHLRI